MKERPKNIGELFKDSLEDLEVNNPTSDWSMLEMKVERLKFFKFGWTYFNIYYASIIGLTFLFSSGVMVDYFFISKKQQRVILADSILSVDSTVEVSDKNIDYQEEELSAKKGDYAKKPKGTLTDKINSDSVSSSSSVKKDSVITPSFPIERKEEKKKTPEKKIIYITKQDTVIIMDTVKTKNKKKLR